ncbi:MAG: putative methyltransferase-domain-containing protein [Benniella sp.]|nr:MAG: putative methyltransferase-domain-containing protein [Benniella sp.]
MDQITLASREYEFNNPSIDALDIDEDPSGLLRGGVGSTIWDAGIVLAKYLERSLAATLAGSDTPTLNILELGSGTGVVGLAAARMLSAMKRRGKVVLTDKENVVPLLQRNADRNKSEGIDIETRVLDWEIVSGIKAIDTTNPSNEGAAAAAAAAAQPESTAPKTTSDASSSSIDSSTAADHQELIDTEWDLVILSDCIWIPALYPPLIGTINSIIKTEKTKFLIAFEKRNFSEEMEFFAMLGKTFRFRDIKPEEQDANYQSEDIYLFTCQRRPE